MNNKLLLFGMTFLFLANLSCKDNGIAKSSVTETPSPKKFLDSTTCVDGARITVDTFVLENNVWGKGNLANYQQCITAKQNDSTTIFAWQWNWPEVGNNVKSYPEIIFGYKPFGNTTTTPLLPKKIADLQSAVVSFSSYATTISGSGNLAFDIWITNSSTPQESNISHEIMIWLERKIQQPAGTFVEHVTIDGSAYDYYRGPLSWDYIAFVKTSTNKVTSVNISEFLTYLKNKNHISANEFLSTIEFGNEVISGTGSTVITNYKVEIK